MRKIAVFLLVVMVGVGCATKEEKARTHIAQTWKIFKVYENEQDVTTDYVESRINYRITFHTNDAFEESYYPFSGADLLSVTGTWIFSDGISKVTLTDNNQTRVYQVDLLDEDNFNITDLGASNGRKIEFIAD